MNILIFAALIWGACKLISACTRNAKQRQAERERERIRQEQQRIREEQAAQREWQREAARRQAEHDRAIAKATKEREAMRKEQERQRKEQERQAKEQARIAKEQEKQAYAIRDLQYRMKVCETEHVAVMQKITNLSALLNLAEAEYSEAEQVGNAKKTATALRKIISINDQLETARKKERKIRYDWNTAKQKLSA